MMDTLRVIYQQINLSTLHTLHNRFLFPPALRTRREVFIGISRKLWSTRDRGPGSRLTKYLTTILFLTVFKHQRQRAHATRMPVKSSTMNIYMLDNETRWDDREIKWQLHNENRECKITNSTHCDT